MVGKSNKGRNRRRGSHGNASSSEAARAQTSGAGAKENTSTVEPSVVDTNGSEPKLESREPENTDSAGQSKQGDLHLSTLYLREHRVGRSWRLTGYVGDLHLSTLYLREHRVGRSWRLTGYVENTEWGEAGVTGETH
ncbi:hypothetical protein SAY87_006887 [Trapa incisa]|uniref:Uncharacterized protein n=1 Tax=Trapa incisa TaxID=236973 RepID=A0AAN7K359_9MYRT|nr:hypothetical protein SAY87_006887 [Trapa incisa]